MFKVGDKVLVKSGKSTNSFKLHGRIGTVITSSEEYCLLDIETGVRTGLWNEELTLINYSTLDSTLDKEIHDLETMGYRS